MRTMLAVFLLVVMAPAPVLAQPVAWTQESASGPSSRGLSAMAFDAARGVAVLFGGNTGNLAVNGETWEWSGAAWNRRFVSGPSARWGHGMVYDSARGVVVLFGGNTGGSYAQNGETWEWNGVTWTQRQVSGPSPRSEFAMAYDAARGVTVLFGGNLGYPNYSNNGETWEWNGTAWSQRAVPGPSPRAFDAMVYDAARRVTVLFGGFLSSNNTGYIYGDTWEWNGSVWVLRATEGPTPRYYHAMAFDSDRRVTVLFGGIVSGLSGGDTWEWNGSVWSQVPESGPPNRNWHAMAFDASRGKTVLFGGAAPPNYLADTWTFGSACGSADFNHDGDSGTDADIEAFFACIGGNCCPTCGSADFNGDGDTATNADIEAFFRVLAGGSC